MRSEKAMYLRSLIFGINDSLVSTVGFLAGISIAGVPRPIIILSGLVYALVEAFSMATGNYLSEESSRDYLGESEVRRDPSVVTAIIMFFSSILAAMIPIAPYLILSGVQALAVSAGVSISGLFILGMLSARFSRLPVLSRGARMAIIGGLSIGLGLLVGLFFPEL